MVNLRYTLKTKVLCATPLKLEKATSKLQAQRYTALTMVRIVKTKKLCALRASDSCLVRVQTPYKQGAFCGVIVRFSEHLKGTLKRHDSKSTTPAAE